MVVAETTPKFFINFAQNWQLALFDFFPFPLYSSLFSMAPPKATKVSSSTKKADHPSVSSKHVLHLVTG
jgi:ABC-type multidrug transport system fused ATPase/permease subunit